MRGKSVISRDVVVGFSSVKSLELRGSGKGNKRQGVFNGINGAVVGVGVGLRTEFRVIFTEEGVRCA